MNQTVHNRLISFIWSIADDCLRDVYVRGKYRDVILPMVVLRRLDALLEPTKEAVMEELVFQRDEAGFTEWDETGLKDAVGMYFTIQVNGPYSGFTTLQQIASKSYRQILKTISTVLVLTLKKLLRNLNSRVR